MKKYILILLLFSSAVSFSQSCPTHFLRNDTTIIIVCSNDKVNISNIYRTVGMSVTWNIGDSTKAGLGTARLIADSSGCRDTAFITIRQDINNWLGAVDSNWANPQNWSNEKIPDSTSNVIISPATNACILSSYASVATLQVLKDARFKILNNQVLKILSKCDTLTPLIELDANTIVLDTATTKKIQSVTVTAITFNGSTAQIQALTPGNIIVSDVAANAPNGFLRMITSIQKNGATTTVITTTVTLTEAFKELHINSSKTYYEDDTTAKPTTAFEPFTKDIDQVLYDADGDESTTHDQVKVTGKLEIKPTVNVDFDITKRSVKYAKMEFIFERDRKSVV